MDASFWAHVAAEFASFVVIAFVLYRYVWPLLKRMMEQRQDAVQHQVEESERAAARLREAQRRYEAALEEARVVAHREQTVRRLRAEIGGLAMRLAEQLVVDSLADEGRRQATVDTFLDELDRLPGSHGAGRAPTPEAAPVAGGAS
jgi:F-type H+-transporting ATPase subunit b